MAVRWRSRRMLFGALLGMGALTFGPVPAAEAAHRPARSAATALPIGPVEAVPTMQSGLPSGASGVAVLGTLGSDLYLFGSQSETTGNIAGVWRYRAGVWTKIGETSARVGYGIGADYNRLAPYGAVEYQGNLYVGDRRIGNLYRLVLNPDGSFRDVVVAAKVGNEDVLPGPVWRGRLALGTFGAYGTGENAGVYAYDGTTVTKLLDLTGLGNAGFVTSMVVYGNDLWVTGINAAASLSQVWRIDPSLRATLMHSGPVDYRLVTHGRDLYAVRTTFAFPYETHAIVRWSGNRFVTVSGEIGLFLAIGSLGGISLGGTILDLCYYNGIYALHGTALQPVVPGMPTMGAPMSVKLHQGYLWIASNQPVGLYRAAVTSS
ncbi:MAG: hypothetical protein ACRD12_23940 [Acidimicrobiales bacterium]